MLDKLRLLDAALLEIAKESGDRRRRTLCVLNELFCGDGRTLTALRGCGVWGGGVLSRPNMNIYGVCVGEFVDAALEVLRTRTVKRARPLGVS